MVFERGDLLFIFNWHHTKSYVDYRIGSKWASEHVIVLDTDENDFNGLDRLKDAKNLSFPIIREPWKGRPNHFHVYLPTRTAIVLCAEENLEKYGIDKPLEKMSAAFVSSLSVSAAGARKISEGSIEADFGAKLDLDADS